MASHPLEGIQLTVANFKGFADVPTGFQSLQPINVIIGRNNTGKSALIDAVELCISKGKFFNPLKHGRDGKDFQIFLTQALDERSLRTAFREDTSGGGLPGNHWEYGRRFLGHPITRKFGANWRPELQGDDIFHEIRSSRAVDLNTLLQQMRWPFDGIQMLRMSAERDVCPEPRSATRHVQPNGAGTTNLVRAFINSEDLPRSEVEVQLLSDLNSVYQGDCSFTQILTREDNNDVWEIFLREEDKGDIRLSQSGSSLKSIFILLSMMRLRSNIEAIEWSKVILAVEEPENNLHPSLLRRLLNFLAEERAARGFTLLVTTHSPVCIDWATKRIDSQIIHVQHRAGVSTARTAIGYSHARDILDDLDVRASDILQANGVIWVEGPSDRIYLKRWLELISDGEIKEGVHYTTMFYGGKVLAHFDGLPPDESDALVSLISLNRNAALLMDSDRHLGGGKTKSGKTRKPRMQINGTKRRIKDELESIGGFVWVTDGREVENYTTASVYGRLTTTPITTIDMYDDIPSLPALKEFKENKVAIAHSVAANLTRADLNGHLDLETKLAELAQSIRSWNGLLRA